jgi:hypothetical protein
MLQVVKKSHVSGKSFCSSRKIPLPVLEKFTVCVEKLLENPVMRVETVRRFLCTCWKMVENSMEYVGTQWKITIYTVENYGKFHFM